MVLRLGFICLGCGFGCQTQSDILCVNCCDTFNHFKLSSLSLIFQGSMTAMTVFFPLDTARLRLQGKTLLFKQTCLH